MLDAAEQWNPRNHSLFPAPARARARELVRLGKLLARTLADNNQEAFYEAWREGLMAHAVFRDYGTEDSAVHKGLNLVRL